MNLQWDPSNAGQSGAASPRWPSELLAHAAGVIDSDGSGIRRDTHAMRVRPLNAGPVYKERVTLRQIVPQAVDLLHDAFGGSRFISAPRNARAQPLHSWQIVDRMAATFLAAITPYLRIKRRQLSRASSSAASKRRVGEPVSRTVAGTVGGGPRPDDLTVVMGDLRAEVMRLNRVEGRAAGVARELAAEAADNGTGRE